MHRSELREIEKLKQTHRYQSKHQINPLDVSIGETDTDTGKETLLFPDGGRIIAGKRLFNSSLPLGSKVNSQPTGAGVFTLKAKSTKNNSLNEDNTEAISSSRIRLTFEKKGEVNWFLNRTFVENDRLTVKSLHNLTLKIQYYDTDLVNNAPTKVTRLAIERISPSSGQFSRLKQKLLVKIEGIKYPDDWVYGTEYIRITARSGNKETHVIGDPTTNQQQEAFLTWDKEIKIESASSIDIYNDNTFGFLSFWEISFSLVT